MLTVHCYGNTSITRGESVIRGIRQPDKKSMQTPQIKAIAEIKPCRSNSSRHKRFAPDPFGKGTSVSRALSMWLIKDEKVRICPQVLELKHGGTHSLKLCSTHQDDTSTMNKQTAPKTTKVGDVFSRCLFILLGNRLGHHGPRGPIGLELFYTSFRHRSCWQHPQSVH